MTWSHDWTLALVGGVLIGLAAAALLLGLGRIAGASGILRGALRGALLGPRDGVWAERIAFLGGLLLAPLAYWTAVSGDAPQTEFPLGWPVMAAGGLIVGLGVRFGGGCTSGHGVCGLSRFSRRSAVAVAVFMGVAAATVAVTRHVL